MKDGRLVVAVIVASTREGRAGPMVARWIAGEAARRDDILVETLDLGEVRPPDVLAAAPPPALVAAGPALAAADAFVVVTPEYNHSFPGPLKNFIDWHNAEWHAKPVAFVSYGGASGGLRAVEHLRQVFAELNAVTIRQGVSLHGIAQSFDSDGRPTQPERLATAADRMLRQLTWWAQALRNARTRSPFPG